MDTLTRLLATSLGIGYIPVWAPTWASGVAAVLAWFIPTQDALVVAVLVLTLAAFWACAPSTRVFQSKDPQKFVLDEVCGMMLSLLFLPKIVPIYLAAFILFRIFDAGKPWPISIIQKNSHPFCIVWDDLAAGVFANLALQMALHFL